MEKQNLPVISVILPVFNRKHLIKRALLSVENQTFKNFELLIVDDGSTDGLEEVVLPEILQKPHWRYLKHSNRKIAATRNIGIHAALGTYVTFLDSDDEYLPRHLQIRMEYMQSNPHVDLVHGGIQLLGPQENHWVVDVRHPSHKIHIQDCNVGATFFGKKAVFVAIGGFPNVSYSSEYYLMEKLKQHYRVVKMTDSTYLYHTEEEDRVCKKVEKQASN